jgi:N-acetylneuraminic acid mutarotase
MKKIILLLIFFALIFSIYLNGTMKWLTKASCIASRVYCSTAVGKNTNGDSCIYVMAGYNGTGPTASNYEYNPKADTTGGAPWATRNNMPNPLRWDAAASNAPRSSVERIYVCGGSDANMWGPTYFPYCDEYTPSTNQWLSRSNMSVAREGPCAATLRKKVYVIGGGDDVVGPRNTNERYNISPDSWTTMTSMTYARADPAAAVGINASGDTCIYVFGGADNTIGTMYSYNEEYNCASNSWTTKTSMPTARSGLLAITYNDTLIYCMGGVIDALSGIDTRAVEVYNTRQNSWTIETQLPTARDGMAGGYVKNVPPDEFSLIDPTLGETVATITPTLYWHRTFEPKIWIIAGAEGNTIITKNNAADLDPDNSLTYTLWYGLYSDFSSYTEVTGLTDTFYTTPALLYDTVYYWKVKAIGSEQWCNQLDWWFRTPTETAVELISFSAWLYYGDVKVIWRTESEKENVQWLIERAYEKPSDFVSIGTVEGQGTKPTPTDYSFTDNRVSKEGKYFYRIGSVDTEGEILWQEPVFVIFKKSSSKDLLTVYNDNHRIKVNYIVTKPTEVTVEIFDKTGRRVKKLYEGMRERGNYTLTWSGREDNGKRASQGVYFCRMEAGEKTQTVKFVYMR